VVDEIGENQPFSSYLNLCTYHYPSCSLLVVLFGVIFAFLVMRFRHKVFLEVLSLTKGERGRMGPCNLDPRLITQTCLKVFRFGAGHVAQALEHLSNKLEALTSNSSTTKKKKCYIL
jgi:hypothetical protein